MIAIQVCRVKNLHKGFKKYYRKPHKKNNLKPSMYRYKDLNLLLLYMEMITSLYLLEIVFLYQRTLTELVKTLASLQI